MDPDSGIAILMGVCMGVGLAAACGFRVFIPLLTMSIAVRGGYLEPVEGFEWIGSWPAVTALGVATIVEIGAYYIPWVDNALDSIATPAATVAGTFAAAAFIGDLDPLMKWALALIAGGGAATAVHTSTVVTRSASSLTTGGLGNPAVATAEAGSATALSLLAILLPLLAGAVVLVVLSLAIWFLLRRRRAATSTQPRGPASPDAAS